MKNVSYEKKFDHLSKLDLNDNIDERFYRDYYFGRIYSHNACDKIYKSSFIKKHNILFGDNKIIFSEDNYFQFQVLKARPVISFVSTPYYYYVVRRGSIMNSYKAKLMERHLKMLESFYGFTLSKDILTQKVIDAITFDCLISEIINVVENRLAFKEIRKSFKFFYNSYIYKRYVRSMIKNKSYFLEPNKPRRIVMVITTILFKLKLHFFAEFMLYFRYKYLRR